MSQGMKVAPVTPLVPELVSISPGTFTMGSDAPTGAPYYGSPQTWGPAHLVTISYPYWIGKFEVTQSQYEFAMGSNPSAYVGADRPVERVSWYDARAYCEVLTAEQSALGNIPTGYEYRLPTEAEWEYACRAGTTTAFGVGNGVALYCADAAFAHTQYSGGSCVGWFGGADVGSYPPNHWGLFDMHGNVLEWCLDGWSNYSASPSIDPFSTGDPNKVYRGGAWPYYAASCQSASRDATPATVGPSGGPGLKYHGFRVVLAPTLVP
ncbi:MAG: formylglycine-generating enzyme family protein [Planctomycetota bacterium]